MTYFIASKYFFRAFLLAIVLALFGLMLSFSPQPAKAVDSPFTLGVVSDSGADEYRANDGRGAGTPWEETTLNWLELLQNHRGVNLGAWGSRGEPRRFGYEYNWARTGAQARDVITSGAHTGMAQQIAAGEIDVVFFSIGVNDFAYYRDGASIYSGTLAGAALTNKINAVVVDITTALDTMLDADPNLQVLVGTIADMGNTPATQAQFPDPVRRQRVTDAINAANAGITAVVAARPRAVLFDVTAFSNVFLSQIDGNGNLNVGGALISFLSNGIEPHNAILSDGIHGGTVFNAVYANELMTRFNQMLDTQVPTFTDEEILIYAGIDTGRPKTTIAVTTGSNDAYENSSTYSINGSTVHIGGNASYYGGFRFANAPVPQGSHILDAYVEVYSVSSQWITVDYDIYGENAGSSGAFTQNSRPSSRVGTVARLSHHSNVSWAANTWYKLRPVTAIVQEIVERGDWVSGNALTILLRGTGGTSGRKSARSFNGSASFAPRLVVIFEAGPPLRSRRHRRLR